MHVTGARWSNLISLASQNGERHGLKPRFVVESRQKLLDKTGSSSQ